MFMCMGAKLRMISLIQTEKDLDPSQGDRCQNARRARSERVHLRLISTKPVRLSVHGIQYPLLHQLLFGTSPILLRRFPALH